MKLRTFTKLLPNSLFKPHPKLLVVGSPRSGFTLLISILNKLVYRKAFKRETFRRELRRIIEKGSQDVDKCVKEYVSSFFDIDKLVLAPDFVPLLGGPKWLSSKSNDMACVRKYLGIIGEGDFLAVYQIPKFAMDLQFVIHSHNDPNQWLADNYYNSYIKFSSMRNFLDVINSSVFSLNALTGDYIDNVLFEESDLIRESLGLYKLTDLNFIEGLITPLISYLRSFEKVKDRYIIMKWEDLITMPETTIFRIAEKAGLNIPISSAKNMWQKMKFKNQTVSHRHNFRKGIIGDWKNYLVNEHLEILKGYGFDDYLSMFGYEKIQFIDRKNYTPFQKKVESSIKKGQIIQEISDPDLFMFAFNKSNFVSSKYDFVGYSKNGLVEIERSSIKNEMFFNGFIDAVEVPIKRVNGKIMDIYQDYYDE
ncbi:sulfotransferase domain-containing protein [Desulfotignum phosphitoxidans]|uniref:Sulfotransferase family protein n=1 Tax=Desulfotignum phosphitoxidans DSM 13687 TaxID=1286635 RepID=S0G7F8_9BACT|nr:sulfotransferase domain-containing protein [Desulfotignum phosphitoxidans]EMS80861.1 sulfotransferase family protein [Desulfotignum phosphitoxidans DSM 13687]